jgi:hypothetical protein
VSVKVAALATNTQNLQNVARVVEAMASDLNVDSSSISLRPGRAPLVKAGKSLSIGQDSSSFYRRSLPSKCGAYMLQKRASRNLEQADILILGHLGAQEYALALQYSLQWRTRTYLVQDAILLLPERLNRWKRFTRYLYRAGIKETVCHRIFVSGQATRETLVRDGVDPCRIVVSGIPRYARLNSKHHRGPRATRTLLFIGSAFVWHRYPRTWEEGELSVLRSTISSVKSVIPSIRCLIRPHPRGPIAAYCSLASEMNCELVPDDRFHDACEEADTMWSYGYPSSVLFEALGSGRRLLFFERAYDYSALSLPAPIDRLFDVVRTVNETVERLRSCSEPVQGERLQYARYFVQDSPDAADDIAKCIAAEWTRESR